MILFNPLKLLFHVKYLWNKMYVKSTDLNQPSTTVEAGDTVNESIGKLQAQIDEIIETIGS